jgi:NitT/TauT family transport system substrate-binding protein
MIATVRSLVLVLSATIWLTSPAPAWGVNPAPIQIRLSVDEDPIVPQLAKSLGYFRDEGIEIIPVMVESFAKEDYLLQKPLIDGQIDAAYHWFHHAVFGARHRLPLTAVMLFNDAPGMTVMVANTARDRIRSAADFRSQRVAQGAGYGTKSLLTAFLANKAGLTAHSYTPVLIESQGRQAAVLAALQAGAVEVMTFQEPVTSALQQTGLVTTLYDFNNAQSTQRVFGAPWPAQSLLVDPAYIKRHPQHVQRLVNAFVRTMRYINSHSAAEIAAVLPPEYFIGKDRAQETRLIAASLPTYTRRNYGFPLRGVRLVMDAIAFYDFDASAEGQWRATREATRVDPTQLYTNRFVNQAMRSYP